MKFDRKEKYFWNRRKFKAVDEIIRKEMGDSYNKRGASQRIWERRKELLLNLYNIKWKTPKELNPHIKFD